MVGIKIYFLIICDIFFFVEELVEDDLNRLTIPNELAGALPVWSSTRIGCEDRNVKCSRQ